MFSFNSKNLGKYKKLAILAAVLAVIFVVFAIFSGKIPGLNNSKNSDSTQNQSSGIKLISEKTDFKRDEAPELKFQYQKADEMIVSSKRTILEKAKYGIDTVTS